MKLTLLSAALLAGSAAAVPTRTSDNAAPLAKRAGLDDAATGFASENGGTTGGSGGTTVTVASFAEFTAAVAGTEKKVVVVSGPITEAAPQVKVGSNTSIVGKDSTAVFTGFGLMVKEESNVIIRNIGISKVIADNGDAIAVQKATNVWIDHVDLSSDLDSGKDFYDGLIDFTHAADFVTVSNSYIHDHFKASLIGHSDSNGDEDTGFLHVTENNNHWANVNSRMPSIRFGTGHIYNSYFSECGDGINTRQGAEVLVESNVYAGIKKPLYSTDAGFAVENDNDFGEGENTALAGTLTSVPYEYELLGSGAVQAAIEGKVGNNLSF
ncbi:hypothetical protein V493_03061 [Pseudogymnoascus sp. VKM F-4281 (FW-2241)]|nr:hypothetical protein V493_03061 [Pseudogymnoascus sp. VKM F-4281 (FW-2241)]